MWGATNDQGNTFGDQGNTFGGAANWTSAGVCGSGACDISLEGNGMSSAPGYAQGGVGNKCAVCARTSPPTCAHFPSSCFAILRMRPLMNLLERPEKREASGAMRTHTRTPLRACRRARAAARRPHVRAPHAPTRFSRRLSLPRVCLTRDCSREWLGYDGRNGGGPSPDGSAAPSAAGGAALPGMDGLGGGNTVQELVKITGCDYNLCAQALEATNNDPQRCAPRPVCTASAARACAGRASGRRQSQRSSTPLLVSSVLAPSRP